MKYTDDPQLRLGPHPKIGAILARDSLTARLLTVGLVVPSKAHEAQWTIERHRMRFRIRVWWRGVDLALWFSPGYYELRWPRMALIWIRAAFRRRERIPRARVVQRSRMLEQGG